jgi:hypothetical protein
MEKGCASSRTTAVVIFTLVPPGIPLHPEYVYYSFVEAAVDGALRRSARQRLNSEDIQREGLM